MFIRGVLEISAYIERFVKHFTGLRHLIAQL